MKKIIVLLFLVISITISLQNVSAKADNYITLSVYYSTDDELNNKLYDTQTYGVEEKRGEIVPIDVSNSSFINKILKEPVNVKNHEFVGFSTDINATKDDSMALAGLNQDTDIYAIYVRTHATVKFVDHNNETIKEVTVEVGDFAQSPDPKDMVRTGYDFDGWDQTTAKIKTDMVIKPVYIPHKQTVTFVGFDGVVLEEEDYLYDDKLVYPDVPEVDGYFFDKWEPNYEFARGNHVITAEYIEIDKTDYPVSSNIDISEVVGKEYSSSLLKDLERTIYMSKKENENVVAQLKLKDGETYNVIEDYLETLIKEEIDLEVSFEDIKIHIDYEDLKDYEDYLEVYYKRTLPTNNMLGGIKVIDPLLNIVIKDSDEIKKVPITYLSSTNVEVQYVLVDLNDELIEVVDKEDLSTLSDFEKIAVVSADERLSNGNGIIGFIQNISTPVVLIIMFSSLTVILGVVTFIRRK